MDIDSANTKLIVNEIRSLSRRVSELPTKNEVSLMISDNMSKCPVYRGVVQRGVDEVTGVHDVSGYRKSFQNDTPTRPSIPAAIAKRIPKPVAYILFAIGSAIAGGISTWAAQ